MIENKWNRKGEKIIRREDKWKINILHRFTYLSIIISKKKRLRVFFTVENSLEE